MERKRILYIQDNDIIFKKAHTFIEERRPYKGLFYHELLREEFQQYVLPGIGLDEIFAILRKYGSKLDLIVADGQANNQLNLPFQLRTRSRLTNAKILVVPMVAPLYSSLSDADFGITETKTPEEIMIAFDNIFAGKTDGYIFNPELYRQKNGILVPK